MNSSLQIEDETLKSSNKKKRKIKQEIFLSPEEKMQVRKQNPHFKIKSRTCLQDLYFQQKHEHNHHIHDLKNKTQPREPHFKS